jgi:hypothetical protein
VKARVSAWGASGCAQGPEEGTGAREQVLASRQDAWRVGRRRRDVEKRGEGQRGPGSSGLGAEAAHGAKEGGAGQQELGIWPARAAGSGREENRGGLEVDEGGLSWKFPNVQGLHCKAKFTFKP